MVEHRSRNNRRKQLGIHERAHTRPSARAATNEILALSAEPQTDPAHTIAAAAARATATLALACHRSTTQPTTRTLINRCSLHHQIEG